MILRLELRYQELTFHHTRCLFQRKHFDGDLFEGEVMELLAGGGECCTSIPEFLFHKHEILSFIFIPYTNSQEMIGGANILLMDSLRI
jgi:hypothetical protein